METNKIFSKEVMSVFMFATGLLSGARDKITNKSHRWCRHNGIYGGPDPTRQNDVVLLNVTEAVSQHNGTRGQAWLVLCYQFQ